MQVDPPKLVVILQTHDARERFLAHASECLPSGEWLVRVVELRSHRTAVLTLPRDASASLVAREPPLVCPGGVTELVSYYRVHDARAVEVRVAPSGVHVEREVELSAAC